MNKLVAQSLKSTKLLEILVNKEVFNNDNYFLFVFKKTERILTAVYMVTNLLDEHEPLKWDIRKLGLDLLSFNLSLKDKSSAGATEVIFLCLSTILRIVSLLDVARTTGLISEMNFALLKKELLALAEIVNSMKKTSYSGEKFILPGRLFDVSDFLGGAANVKHSREKELPENEKMATVAMEGPDNSKGQNTGDSGSQTPSRTNKLSRKGQLVDKKDIRKNIIINLLRQRHFLTLKDFSDVIKDCGGKTIQRELLELVKFGVLEKTGTRRWSRYHLASKNKVSAGGKTV